MPDHIPGLILSERYYWEIVRPLLEQSFPGLPHSAVLLGPGSEVLGFDTARSSDHHWGLRLILFLRTEDWPVLSPKVDELLRQGLPHQFLGFSTNFSAPNPDDNGVRLPHYLEKGPVEHMIEITTVEDFGRRELGIDPFTEFAPQDWLVFEEQRLLSLTRGRVYYDGLGQLSMLREKLVKFRSAHGTVNARTQMKTIVITGSTRGIGYGMAAAFLEMGCAVIVSGRQQPAVDQAVSALAARFGTERVFGFACDVRKLEQVQSLWDAAAANYGRVDVWINNAGIAHPLTDFTNFRPDTIQAVLDTNIAGMMFGAMTALNGFKQQGGGAIYNMFGLGSTGRQVKRMALYGASKSAVAYLNHALVEETRGQPVLVGALLPGMVVTDLLTQQRDSDPQEWERTSRIFNILADRVETVAPWLARRVLENTRHGAVISWTNPWMIGWRFLSAPFTHRRVIDE